MVGWKGGWGWAAWCSPRWGSILCLSMSLHCHCHSSNICLPGITPKLYVGALPVMQPAWAVMAAPSQVMVGGFSFWFKVCSTGGLSVTLLNQFKSMPQTFQFLQGN